MLASERHREILDRVGLLGAARVVELARTLEVTEETIRRDLRSLAERGALVRTHGGALASPASSEADEAIVGGGRTFLHRSGEHRSAKRAMAREALKWVEPGSVIAVDASSTAVELARLLPDEPLTVVTNGLAVCNVLASRQRVDVVCTGGVLDSESAAFTGLPAERSVAQFNVGVCFCSCMGIDRKRGMSEVDVAQASIKLAMIEAASRTVLLADASKFGVSSQVFTAPASAADVLITDASHDDAVRDELDRLREAGVEVIEVEMD